MIQPWAICALDWQGARRNSTAVNPGPASNWRLCRDYGVYRWFLPHEWDGQGWSEIDVIRAICGSRRCLTTTFILTQRTGACQRIAASENTMLKQRLLPELASGQAFATLGISHLTTSRRHVGQPILRAEVSGNDFFLNGFSPWVTGANHADVIVTGGRFSTDSKSCSRCQPICPG